MSSLGFLFLPVKSLLSTICINMGKGLFIIMPEKPKGRKPMKKAIGATKKIAVRRMMGTLWKFSDAKAKNSIITYSEMLHAKYPFEGAKAPTGSAERERNNIRQQELMAKHILIIAARRALPARANVKAAAMIEEVAKNFEHLGKGLHNRVPAEGFELAKALSRSELMVMRKEVSAIKAFAEPENKTVTPQNHSIWWGLRHSERILNSIIDLRRRRG